MEILTAVPLATPAGYATAGAVIGAVVVPLIIFLAIKINYKNLRDGYASFPQNPAFYRLFAIAGAALFAVIAASQPILEAAGDNEINIRGALIPILVFGIGVPFVRAFERLAPALEYP